MKVKAVVFPGIDQIEIREVELEKISPKQIRTETLYSFVSPGTELRTLKGHYGADKDFTIIPGYSAISRVVEVGSEVKGYKIGDILSNRNCYSGFVDCYPFWGGEAGGHVFEPDADNDTPVLLPEDAKKDPLPYAVAEVASISYRGMQSAEPKTGEHVLVIGQGIIGEFSAEWLRMKGCLVTICDISESRLANAKERGFNYVSLSDPDAQERLSVFGNTGFDIVAECSGSTGGFQLAVKMIRKDKLESMSRKRLDWPRLLLQGNYVDEIPLNPCWFFAGEGIKLLTPSDRLRDDRLQVVEMIRRKEFDPSCYLKNVFKPEEMPDAYRKLQKREIASAVCQWRDL